MLTLPPAEHLIFLTSGRNQAILGSDDRRTAFQIGYASVVPAPWISRGWAEGAFRLEGYAIRTEGHDRGVIDHTDGIGFSAIARYAFRNDSKIKPFVELGTGLIYLTQPTPDVPLRLNFAPQLGLGVRAGRFEFGARLTHISNWNRQRPNRGLDLLTATVAIAF